MITNRQRLEELKPLLDSAPFDVRGLRMQLADTNQLTEEEAGDVLRGALMHLSRVGFALSWLDTSPLPPSAERAHQHAMDWIATARSILMDYSLN